MDTFSINFSKYQKKMNTATIDKMTIPDTFEELMEFILKKQLVMKKNGWHDHQIYKFSNDIYTSFISKCQYNGNASQLEKLALYLEN